ncbi:MAG: hypothetical protein IJP75_03035 [Bacteroidaceae bacterium]|nr:hypothetical protein [Bacteroidaceae bacterium]
MEQIKNNTIQREVTVEGSMTFAKLENGLHTSDFVSFESVQMEAFSAKCKVQIMRDGNVYITELPKRVRNTPIFREDNSSLSLGMNGKYYFVFTIEEGREDELPEQLVRQAKAIAKKVVQSLKVNG